RRPRRRAPAHRDRRPARAAQHRGPAARAGVGVVRDRRARRGGAVLPRLRHPPADPVVGADAAGGPAAARRAAGARAVAGPGDRARGARVQPARRRAARPLRSAAGGPAMSARTVLTVDGLGVGTADLRLVSDVSFSLSAGERVGLIGESGSGKSLTALAMM